MVSIVRGERVGRGGRLAVGCSAAVIDPVTRKILLIRRADNSRCNCYCSAVERAARSSITLVACSIA